MVLRVLFAKLNEPKPRRDTSRANKDKDLEPVFFISEGAMDFTPSDGLGGVDMDVGADYYGTTNDDSRYGYSNGFDTNKTHNRLSSTS